MYYGCSTGQCMAIVLVSVGLLLCTGQCRSAVLVSVCAVILVSVGLLCSTACPSAVY